MIIVKQLKGGVWHEIGAHAQQTQSLDQILTSLKNRLVSGKYKADINGFEVEFVVNNCPRKVVVQ